MALGRGGVGVVCGGGVRRLVAPVDGGGCRGGGHGHRRGSGYGNCGGRGGIGCRHRVGRHWRLVHSVARHRGGVRVGHPSRWLLTGERERIWMNFVS